MIPHPRFPFGMLPDVRAAIGDELDVVLAAWPLKRGSPAEALTAYAEQLEHFTVEDVRAGFKAARAEAAVWAPSPTVVARHAAAARRARREFEAAHQRREAPPAPPLKEIPDWRAEMQSRLAHQVSEDTGHPTPKLRDA